MIFMEINFLKTKLNKEIAFLFIALPQIPGPKQSINALYLWNPDYPLNCHLIIRATTWALLVNVIHTPKQQIYVDSPKCIYSTGIGNNILAHPQSCTEVNSPG